MKTNKDVLFSPGMVVVTAGAAQALQRAKACVDSLVQRHIAGDFGDLCVEDELENVLAIEHGYQVMSYYPLATGGKLMCVTEADRSATTVLVPGELECAQ